MRFTEYNDPVALVLQAHAGGRFLHFRMLPTLGARSMGNDSRL